MSHIGPFVGLCALQRDRGALGEPAGGVLLSGVILLKKSIARRAAVRRVPLEGFSTPLALELAGRSTSQTLPGRPAPLPQRGRAPRFVRKSAYFFSTSFRLGVPFLDLLGTWDCRAVHLPLKRRMICCRNHWAAVRAAKRRVGAETHPRLDPRSSSPVMIDGDGHSIRSML